MGYSPFSSLCHDRESLSLQGSLEVVSRQGARTRHKTKLARARQDYLHLWDASATGAWPHGLTGFLGRDRVGAGIGRPSSRWGFPVLTGSLGRWVATWKRCRDRGAKPPLS